VLTGIVALIMMLIMVKAFGLAPNTVVHTERVSDVIEQIGSPSSLSVDSAASSYSREIRIQRSETLSGLLSGMGIHDEDALDFLRSDTVAKIIFRQLAPGKTLTAQATADGRLQSLAFPLNGGGESVLLLERTSEGFSAQIHRLAVEVSLSQQSAVIRHSLFGAADDAGIPDSVAVQLADIFGGDIDFHRDLRKGDRFSVVYETISHLGRPIRSQRVLAAEFINGGKTHHAFWYQGRDSAGGYYTNEGRSIKKAFLRSPLEFSRITSGFSNSRYHPVLHETRAHRGIDYGAPTGTRVKATGDGVIDFAGTQGGYGKVIMIRHPDARVTAYGHLSGFASGISRGARVAQGDIIGFVGATGIATGPHLHYEFRVAGIHRNPLSVALPSALPLPPEQLSVFRARVSDLLPQIAAIRGMQLVMLD
jgi:murein DD-endopeptidase MepM/ murein hydrolase activator NlpD